MKDDQLKQLSALAALNKMMLGTHFSICTLDDVIKVLGTRPDGQAYDILRPLHCVHWTDMPAELRDAVPRLIERCISIPAYQFQITQVPPADRARVTSGTIRLLTR